MSAADLEREVEGAILEVALSFEDGAAREAFLRRAAGGDPAAVASMRELVEAGRASAGYFLKAREVREDLAVEWLAESADARPDEEAPAAEPGERIDEYRLGGRIGEGGGGVIYEGEQEEGPFRRKVAIKILRAGMDTEAMIERFKSERRTLALMDHPNIARVLDAGATSAGLPYFVMELVEGEKLTDFCDRERLNVRGRLELFIRVCSAIAHAHQKGVVHRDLKPSNILVTAGEDGPYPKVIDFGIAKIVSAPGPGRSTITARDQLFGTPAYMSPEQLDLAGLDIDTRSDIYSLGVLLYELLAGAPPLDPAELAGMGVAAARDRVLENRPVPPSQRVERTEPARREEIAAARKRDVRRLAARIRGDLDRIVMTAIEPDRGRRYQTVDGFSADLRRHLNHQPVTARPPSRTYLVAKFIRRNRTTCLSGLLVAALLVIALGTTFTLYQRERRALAERTRLQNAAEEAREDEARLRRQADARAGLARAAFLLSEDRVEEAEELRKRYPIDSIEPSLEAADTLRALGDWNAIHGRWEQALECFRLHIQANHLKHPDEIIEGNTDILASGIALLRCDDPAYETFRGNLLDRQLPVDSASSAEHLLKVCCAAPAGRELLARLEGAARLLEDPTRATFPGWASLSSALYHLRCGDFPTALHDARRGLGYSGVKQSCVASLHAAIALAEAGAGHPENAEASLTEAKRIQKACDGGDFIDGESVAPVWYDWALVEVLIAEAEGAVSPSG